MSLPRNILATACIGTERVFWSASNMVFKSHNGHPITIRPGFMSDGLSIPRLFQNVFSKSPHFIYAGILHDYLYRKDTPHQLSRKTADKLLLLYMRLYGVGWLTRHTIHTAVRLGGWPCWKKQNARYHP